MGALTQAQIPQAIANAAAQYGVDPHLALEVAIQESGLNQNAVSPAGAIGIFQLMPATAAMLGVDPHDAQQNIAGGIRYLAQLLSQFGGDTAAALAAYNWGPGNVSGALQSDPTNWLSSAPSETQNYVASIMTAIGQSAGSSGSYSVGVSAASMLGGLSIDPDTLLVVVAAGLGALFLSDVLLGDD